MPVWTMCKINILLFSLIDEPVIAWGEKKDKRKERGWGSVFSIASLSAWISSKIVGSVAYF